MRTVFRAPGFPNVVERQDKKARRSSIDAKSSRRGAPHPGAECSRRSRDRGAGTGVVRNCRIGPRGNFSGPSHATGCGADRCGRARLEGARAGPPDRRPPPAGADCPADRRIRPLYGMPGISDEHPQHPQDRSTRIPQEYHRMNSPMDQNNVPTNPETTETKGAPRSRRLRMGIAAAVVAVAAVGGTVTAFTMNSDDSGSASSAAAGKPAGSDVKFPLSTKKGEIVDSQGHKVVLTGVNWFGSETGTFAPHGLWARSWESMLDQMAKQGFNTIRFPYSNEMFAA